MSFENNPAIYGWVPGSVTSPVPSGTKDPCGRPPYFSAVPDETLKIGWCFQSHRTDDLTVGTGLHQPTLPSLAAFIPKPYRINFSTLQWKM